MSWETYDPRIQRPGGQFKGGSCDTMTTVSAICGEEFRKLRKRLPHFAGAENFPSRLPYGGAGGAIVGQLIIPVPVLGGTIGTLVGKAAGHGEGFLASKLIKDKPVDLPVIVRNKYSRYDINI